MSTFPYLSDTPELLKASIGLVYSAYATHPSWAQRMDLEVESCVIRWDESVAPRVSADLSCRTPVLADDMNKLDPRTGVRITITAGYVRSDGVTDSQVIANLGLRSRSVQRPSNIMTLGAASDEAMVIDVAASSPVTPSQATIKASIESSLRSFIASPAVNNTATSLKAPDNTVVLKPEGDTWLFLDNLADLINADIYDNGLRQWFITDRPALREPDAVLTVGQSGTILTSDASLSREGWHNSVQLSFTWTETVTLSDGKTIDVPRLLIGSSSVTAGPFAVTSSNRRTFREARDVTYPISQTDANNVAASILVRRAASGRSLTLSSIAHLWVRPGQTIEVALPTGTPLRYLVTSVSFDLNAGTMNVNVRRPDDNTLITLGE